MDFLPKAQTIEISLYIELLYTCPLFKNLHLAVNDAAYQTGAIAAREAYYCS